MMTKEQLKPQKTREILITYAIFIVLIMIVSIIIYIDPTFLSLENFKIIMFQSSTKIILALGVASIIMINGLDISSGRIMVLASLVSVSFLQSANYIGEAFPTMKVVAIIISVLLVIVLSSIISIVNGIFAIKGKTSIVIITMGMNLILFGVGSLYYDFIRAKTVSTLNFDFIKLTQGSLDVFGFPISNLVIIAAFVMLIVWFVWNKTKVGRSIFEKGINSKYVMIIFAMAGALYGLAGILEVSRIGHATNSMYMGYSLDSIAACTIGGVGSVSGIAIGVVMLQVVTYGLNYINANSDIQYIIKGIIIIIAVLINRRKYVSKKQF